VKSAYNTTFIENVTSFGIFVKPWQDSVYEIDIFFILADNAKFGYSEVVVVRGQKICEKEILSMPQWKSYSVSIRL
jgi:hypothetical protein